MIRRLIFVFGVMTAICAATGPLSAQQPDATTGVPATAPAPENASSPAAQPAASPAVAAAPAPATPEAEALRKAISSRAPGATDEERDEQAALVSFYEARGYAPLWLAPSGGTALKISLLAAEIGRADEWGLDPRDFPLPTSGPAPATPEAAAAVEIDIAQAVLKYGRYARGGRIIAPAEQLSTHLDRRPQLLKPLAILEGIAAAEQPDAYLRGLHPPHPQFEKLRQKYLAAIGRAKPSAAKAGTGKPKTAAKASAEVKRLLANMEEWRWMPTDMGEFYVWNNIPEFMQRVMKNGAVVRKERIVAGEIAKPTSIFSRPIKKITFKPTWIVPDSIKARELWPSLLRGGGLMREWALELRTKEGQPVDWRKVNWTTTDILKYDVIQLNGPKSVMGKVKFTFPSQHTVFMHDTMERDKYMFNVARRTFSHGCMRVAKPIELAEIILQEDKGWDAAHTREVFKTGPLNNEIVLDHKIPIHITYFTALVDDNGKLQTFGDVYGHERRITQALEGKWNQIVKGRDHLAPVTVNLADASKPRAVKEDTRPKKQTTGDLFESIFGGL